jgi:poly-gamma-glutamate capsule biosynthesis protein CapA/YwtB (metallophosphatase superfamily)
MSIKTTLTAAGLLVLAFVLPMAYAEPVRLIFAGDIMLDDGPGRTIANGGDPLAAFDRILKDADYRIGNLECPIATTGSPLDNKIYAFRAHPRVLPVLRGRFDAVSLANNHSGDYGHPALIDTMAQLDSAGIAWFGAGLNLAAAHRPLWITRHGLRIAVLAYNEYKPRAFEAGPDWPGIAWSEDSHVVSDIRAARAAGADLVIPFMHWGWENEKISDARQKSLARRMIDAGADIVVGGHPHVTQDVEFYRNKLIVYSLGNFVFDGFDEGPGRIGWLLRLTVDKSGLIAWDTVAAHLDAQGSPTPLDAPTPCGTGAEGSIRNCRALAPH